MISPNSVQMYRAAGLQYLRFVKSEVWLMMLVLQSLLPAARSFKHVCYMDAPSMSQHTLPMEKVDVSLCSHIIMRYATVARNTTVDLNSIGGYEALVEFAALRQRSPTLELMISVKGDDNVKDMLWSTSSRQRFVLSVVSTLRATNLSGVDLDLKAPNLLYAGKFVSLLKEFSTELKKDTERPLLLSVAVPAKVWMLGEIYRAHALSKWADFVNLMTYEFNTYHWYKPWVNHNSPLHPRSPAAPYFRRLNVEFSAQLWVKMGVPKSKIMVGIPTFGIPWVLRNADSWHVGALATGRDARGGGYVSFADVCSLLKNGTKEEYDEKAMVPYMHKDKLWVSYEDEHSVAVKRQWIYLNGYGGTMTFNLNFDDWSGKCGNGTFPLQRAIAHDGYREHRNFNNAE